MRTPLRTWIMEPILPTEGAREELEMSILCFRISHYSSRHTAQRSPIIPKLTLRAQQAFSSFCPGFELDAVCGLNHSIPCAAEVKIMTSFEDY